MKTFTYAAAIALLTASTAFAQSSNSTMGTAGSTRGQAGISADGSATMGQSSNDMKGSMARPGKAGSSDMNNDSDMEKSSGKAMSHQASRDSSKANHMASNMKGSERGQDSAKENQETAQLNQGQLSGHGMMSNGMGNNGGAMNGNGNSFDNGRPQAAQAGGPDCTPDNPSCGTARRNPAINSSPQHRLQGASPE